MTDAKESNVVLSVIAPCFQEQDNIDALVRRALPVFDSMDVPVELVLVDDGSTDDTWSCIEAQGPRDSRVRGVRHRRNVGIVPAWRSGLEAARGELICLIDADLQNRPEDIPRLLECYRTNGTAIAQAVRHSVGPGQRLHLFTRGLNLLLNTLFGTKLRDGKSGFILCSRAVLADILRHRFRYRYYQSFIGAAAAAHGYAIGEVNTVFDARNRGRSFLPRFPIRATVRILWELVKFRWETWTEINVRKRGQPVVKIQRSSTLRAESLGGERYQGVNSLATIARPPGGNLRNAPPGGCLPNDSPDGCPRNDTPGACLNNDTWDGGARNGTKLGQLQHVIKTP